MVNAVFNAFDGTHGYELWVTDGTATGTSLVLDIYPGASFGNPVNTTALGNGKALFSANDGASNHGNELWVTDGTAAGTSMVLDINPTGDSAPSNFGALGNGVVLFRASDGTHGQELWATDGTAAGTSMVKDINAGTGDSLPQLFAAIGNGKALFRATDGATHGAELWVTDGTSAGTSMVLDINAGTGNSSPGNFTVIGSGKVLFSATDGTSNHGTELWVTDGTAAGTSMILDINAGTGNSNPAKFAALGNGKFVFSATDNAHGQELWVTDGTGAGTSLVLDISPSAGSIPNYLTALGNGKVLFRANDGTHGTELWITDGTAAGTSMVKDIYPGTGNSSPTKFTALGNGKSVFSATDSAHGAELWVTDGTAAGTSLVLDINPGAVNATPNYLTALGNGTVLFRANDGTHGTELWITDGTAAGTSLVQDINPGATGGNPGQFAVLTSALCFVAGTLIATPTGQVPVEALRTGQIVLTASGAARPIAWTGQGQILATRGRRGPATPVIVKKGALAENVPSRDLHVTKGHALYLDDVLIPVEFLVNHRSILWDDRAQEVKLYHIELDSHDVLIANGAPAESYRDDGNRWLFQNANSGWDQPAKPPYAPVLTGGATVDAVWRRLLDRAGPRPGLPLTDDTDLHVLADGVRIDRVRCTNGVFMFNLPATATDIRLVSRAAAPQELGHARDPRVLGVAVRHILVRRGGTMRTADADNPVLTEGFHAFEPDNAWRWTDGEARLPAELVRFGAGPIELIVAVASTAIYFDTGASRRAA